MFIINFKNKKSAANAYFIADFADTSDILRQKCG